jgi:RNA polymerase sigma-70 factor (ECF subfamily)
LYQAVKFQIAKQLRKRPLHPLHLEVMTELKSTHRAEEAVLLNELSEQIEQVITALPPRCQEIFRLSRFENLSNKEIAARLNLSISTVENQINIALRALRANLDEALICLLLLILL